MASEGLGSGSAKFSSLLLSVAAFYARSLSIGFLGSLTVNYCKLHWRSCLSSYLMIGPWISSLAKIRSSPILGGCFFYTLIIVNRYLILFKQHKILVDFIGMDHILVLEEACLMTRYYLLSLFIFFFVYECSKFRERNLSRLSERMKQQS